MYPVAKQTVCHMRNHMHTILRSYESCTILTLLKVHLLIDITTWTHLNRRTCAAWQLQALQKPMVDHHFPQEKTLKVGRPLWCKSMARLCISGTRPTEFADWVPSPKGISKLSRSLPALGLPRPFFLRALRVWDTVTSVQRRWRMWRRVRFTPKIPKKSPLRQRPSCPSCPSSTCLSSFFVLVHQFLWNSGSRTHGPGKLLKLAHLLSCKCLQSCSHAAPFLRLWYLMKWSSIDVFNKWTFASGIWDSSAILVELPAHGRQKTIILITLLHVSMLPLFTESTDHVLSYPAWSKNTSQVVWNASNILQPWNSAKSELTHCLSSSWTR